MYLGRLLSFMYCTAGCAEGLVWGWGFGGGPECIFEVLWGFLVFFGWLDWFFFSLFGFYFF